MAVPRSAVSAVAARCTRCGALLELAPVLRWSRRLLRCGAWVGCRCQVVTLRCECGREWREVRAVATTSAAARRT
jgi:hypothetical protein